MIIPIKTLIIAFFLLCAGGALLSLFVPNRRNPGVMAWIGSLASLAVMAISAEVLQSGESFRMALWKIYGLGEMAVSIDRLSAIFLFVTGMVVLCIYIFSAGYLKHYEGRYSLKALNAWCMMLFASVVMILISSDALSFLLSWEIMSVLSYILVNFEHRRPEAGRAAYMMLIMTEAGFMAVVIAFLFFAIKAGSMHFSAFRGVAAGFGVPVRWMIFLLTFFGFGSKAGIVPVNTWLPRAHPVTPANISALLSGVILNLGLYGIIRVNMDLMPMTMIGPGLVVLVFGTLSALVGILYATTENDIKVMLAHSSVENIGIILAGLGAGMVFVACGHNVLAAIAFVAAFYHLLNHSLYKSLLFFGAGMVETRTGTRDMDKLGGLIKWMPLTALGFLSGSLAISGLPPFNGFVSEWLTLQTMLRSAELSSIGVKLVFVLCGVGLALTAGLAVTCFVKAFAMSFLGIRRGNGEPPAREVKSPALAAIIILSVLCLLFGVLPTYVIPVLAPAVAPLANGANASVALIPPFFSGHPAHHLLPPAFAADFNSLGAQIGQNVLPGRGLVVLHRGATANPVVFAMSTFYMFIVLALLLLLTWVLVRLLTRGRKSRRGPRWDGGVRRLLPEMTYTATGFSNPVRVVFDAIFRPTTVEDTQETVAKHFRTAIRRKRKRVYLVDRLIDPFRNALTRCARLLALMHHGQFNAYATYVLVTLLIVLMVFLFQAL